MQPLIATVILTAIGATVVTGARHAVRENVVDDEGPADTAGEGIASRPAEAPPR